MLANVTSISYSIPPPQQHHYIPEQMSQPSMLSPFLCLSLSLSVSAKPSFNQAGPWAIRKLLYIIIKPKLNHQYNND